MKLLLLLSLIVLASGDEAFIPEKITETNDVSQQAITDFQSQANIQEGLGDKKIGKRSYALGPWSSLGGYGLGWPWYGSSSLGLGGWYPGWPSLYAGHGYGYVGYRGWPGGWYKRW